MPRKKETRVVNVRKEEPDVYIGRGKGGIWGNPFVKGTHGDRSMVISKYRVYIIDQILMGERKWSQFLELVGKSLGCYCHPQACHGDTLKWLVDIAERCKTEEEFLAEIRAEKDGRQEEDRDELEVLLEHQEETKAKMDEARFRFRKLNNAGVGYERVRVAKSALDYATKQYEDASRAVGDLKGKMMEEARISPTAPPFDVDEDDDVIEADTAILDADYDDDDEMDDVINEQMEERTSPISKPIKREPKRNAVPQPLPQPAEETNVQEDKIMSLPETVVDQNFSPNQLAQIAQVVAATMAAQQPAPAAAAGEVIHPGPNYVPPEPEWSIEPFTPSNGRNKYINIKRGGTQVVRVKAEFYTEDVFAAIQRDDLTAPGTETLKPQTSIRKGNNQFVAVVEAGSDEFPNLWIALSGVIGEPPPVGRGEENMNSEYRNHHFPNPERTAVANASAPVPPANGAPGAPAVPTAAPATGPGATRSKKQQAKDRATQLHNQGMSPEEIRIQLEDEGFVYQLKTVRKMLEIT